MSDVMCVSQAGAWIMQVCGRREGGARVRRTRAGRRERSARRRVFCLSASRLLVPQMLLRLGLALFTIGIAQVRSAVSVSSMIFRNSLSRATQLRDTSHTHIFRAGPPSEAWPAAHITPPPGLLPTPHTALDIKKEGSPSYPYPFNRPDPRAFPTIMANRRA